MAEKRIDLEELHSRAEIMLPIECPRVVHGKNSVYAATEIELDVDSTGAVQRAAIEHGSGDASLDDLFGALAAQLQLPPPTPRAAQAVPGSSGVRPTASPAPLDRRSLTVSYACAPNAGTIALQLQKG